MTHPDGHRPIDPETLLAYWLGELDEARTQQVDRHLLGCDRCGAELDALIALGDGVRRAFDAGLVGTAVGPGFVQRLAGRGLRLREYVVPRNGSVLCRIEPEDDVVLGRLQAPLAGLARVDLVRHPPGGGAVRAEDIPFDGASGEVVIVTPAAYLRGLPTSVERMELFAVDAAGERLLGDYTFNHRAADAGAAAD